MRRAEWMKYSQHCCECWREQGGGKTLNKVESFERRVGEDFMLRKILTK